MTDYEQANKLLQDAQRIRYRQGAYSWVHICPTILNQMAIDKYTQAGRMYQKCNKMENASFAYLEAAEIAQSCPRNLHKAFQNMFLATFCFMEVVGNIEHVDLICFNKCVLMSIEAGDIEGSAVLADKIVDKLKSLKKGKSSQIINFYKGVIEAYEIHNGEYSTESYIDKYKLELFEYLLMWGDHGQAFDLFDEIVIVTTENASKGDKKSEGYTETSLIESSNQGQDGKQLTEAYFNLLKLAKSNSRYFKKKGVSVILKDDNNVKSENKPNGINSRQRNETEKG